MENFKKYPLLLPLIICTAITLILGVILILPERSDGEETEIPPETSPFEETQPPVMENPIFKTDLSAYEPYMDVAAGSYLILVNKENTIGASHEPTDLISVKDTHKDIKLRRTAEMALEAMFIEMRAAGFDDVFVTSAYRSYSYQSGLFNNYIDEERAKDPALSYAEARELVLRYSAAPGTSEHQTGLCVDLMTKNMSTLDETFAQHRVYAWLLENAWKFGFVLRFPADKTEITGYDFEPWHYRFVGRYDAYKMWKNKFLILEC